MEASLARAAVAVREAKALVVCAGAGMGVDSGLPDFRGPEGLWRAYPPLKKRGLTLPATSTPHWFKSDPKFAWGFFGHRRNLYNSTEPHAGFQILRRWGESMEGGCAVFTSNIDGHFQRAGFSEEQVEECHGTLQFMQCCLHDEGRPCPKEDDIWPSDNVELIVDEVTLHAKEPLPRCPACGGTARPNVLMFSDDYWVPDRTDSQNDRFRATTENMRQSESAFVVVEIGAGLAVPTVRMQSEAIVSAATRATLIRINPREPEVPEGHISLPMGGLEALTAIDNLLEEP